METLFEAFLKEAAKALQLPPLSADAQGACLIVMQEANVPFLFEFDTQLVPDTVLLSSPIHFVPPTHALDIYEALLKGNSAIEETLSIQQEEATLYLHRRLHPAMESGEIAILLKIFIETILVWKEKVLQICQSPPKRIPSRSHPPSIQVFPYKV